MDFERVKRLAIHHTLVAAVLSGRKRVTRRVFYGSQPFRPGEIICIGEPHRFLERTPDGRVRVQYKADNVIAERIPTDGWRPKEWGGKWSQTRFMPVWAARPNRYRVVSTELQYLQQISGPDAILEGYTAQHTMFEIGERAERDAAKKWFREKWDTLNEKRPGFVMWANNPRVVRIEWEPV